MLAEREAAAAGAGPRTVAAPIVLNAANEVAVAAFLDRRLGFPGIAEVVEASLDRLGDQTVASLDDVYACDAEARRFAAEAIAGSPDRRRGRREARLIAAANLAARERR